jgi:acyl carrier protein
MGVPIGARRRQGRRKRCLCTAQTTAVIAEAVRQGRIDERAAIGIFLVGADNAGNRMVAGAVGQRLMTAGPAYGVGLCPIGGYETRWLGNLIDAQAGTVVHSLVGGLIEPEQTTAWQTEASTRARIADRVRDCLAASLPGYMVPSAFVELDRLPLTANGKVDRRALPAPAPVAAAGHPATARRSNALERKVLDIWEEVLDLRGIDPGSQFFDIGGDSLKIVQVQIRLRSVLKTNVSLRRLYEHQTVESLARLLAEIDPALLAAGSTAPRTSVVAAVSLQQQRRLRIAAMTDEQVACLLAEQRRVPSRGEIEHAI